MALRPEVLHQEGLTIKISVVRHVIPAPDCLSLRPIKTDREALEELFSCCRVRLYNTAFKILGNRDDAEDALQDGLLAAYRNRYRFEGRSQFSTWLTRIIVNVALMRRRRDRFDRIVSIDQNFGQEDQPIAARFLDPRPNPEEIYVWQEQLEHIERLLHCVPTVDRQAFWLRHIKGLKVREVAEIVGIPVGTLKSQLHRARRRLRKVATNVRHSGEALHSSRAGRSPGMYQGRAFRR